MSSLVRTNLMPQRRDWNALGPKIPLWFKAALKRVDPKLVMQFIPPDWWDAGGIDRRNYPNGVWIIVKVLRRSGLLLVNPRWTHALADVRGNHKQPDHTDLRLIRYARDKWRGGHKASMWKQMDAAMSVFKKERAAADRVRLATFIESRLAEIGFRARRT
ncbi:MAG: hypothetical protein ACKV2Q_36470 [Planctomycetaceae bacterium]